MKEMCAMSFDSEIVNKIVEEVKNEGLFDKFRKDCLQDVDTKPSYQNLKQRTIKCVREFLEEEKWTPDTNKIQLREKLRRHIVDQRFLDLGLDRIVDQVLNPKFDIVYRPQLEEVAYKVMGLPPPPKTVPHQPPLPSLPQILSLNVTPFGLPTDLEQVSPDSDRVTEKSAFKDDIPNTDKIDENDDYDEESPPFEPLGNNSPLQNENTTVEDMDTSDSPPPPPLPPPTPPPPPPPEDNTEVINDTCTTENTGIENHDEPEHESVQKELDKSVEVTQESQLSQVSSDSRISTCSADYGSTDKKNKMLVKEAAVNISEEAQMPKFSENSNDVNVNVTSIASELHFDIKKDEIKFEGTERHPNLPPNSNRELFEDESSGVLATTIETPQNKEIPQLPESANSNHKSVKETLDKVQPSSAQRSPPPDHSMDTSLDDSRSIQLTIVERPLEESSTNTISESALSIDQTLKQNSEKSNGKDGIKTTNEISATQQPSPPPVMKNDNTESPKILSPSISTTSQSQSSKPHKEDRDKYHKSTSSSSSHYRKHSKDSHRSRDSERRRERGKDSERSRDHDRDRDSGKEKDKHRDKDSDHKSKHSSSSKGTKTSSSHRRSEKDSSSSRHLSSSSSRSEDKDHKRHDKYEKDKRSKSASSKKTEEKDKRQESSTTIKDDHNSYKKKPSLRKSTDSDGDDKHHDNIAPKNSKSSTSPTGSGSSSNKECSNAKESNTMKNTNDTPQQTHANKVVFLNEKLENPNVNFVVLGNASNDVSQSGSANAETTRHSSNKSLNKKESVSTKNKTINYKSNDNNIKTMEATPAKMPEKACNIQTRTEKPKAKSRGNQARPKARVQRPRNLTAKYLESQWGARSNAPRKTPEPTDDDSPIKINRRRNTHDVVVSPSSRKLKRCKSIANEANMSHVATSKTVNTRSRTNAFKKKEIDKNTATAHIQRFLRNMSESPKPAKNKKKPKDTVDDDDFLGWDTTDNVFAEKLENINHKKEALNKFINSWVENAKKPTTSPQDLKRKRSTSISLNLSKLQALQIDCRPSSSRAQNEERGDAEEAPLHKKKKKSNHHQAKISPTPSESSINSKENEHFDKYQDSKNVNTTCQIIPIRRISVNNKLNQQQRYNSEDLYKPRLMLSQRSRRRGVEQIL